MTDLAWEADGDGDRTLLCLHPGVGDRSFWDLAWSGLTDLGRAVRYDARAFGASPDPEADFSPVADAVAVLDAAGVDRAVVIGVSYGAHVALELAVTHPERVAGLVLVSGPGDADEDPALAAQIAEVDRLLTRGDLDEANELEVDIWAGRAEPSVREWMREKNRELLVRQEPLEPDTVFADPPATERLGEVGAPVLVMLGVHDQPSSIAGGRAVAAGTGGDVVEIAGAGHLLGREQPDAFVYTLTRWLARR